MLIQKLILNNFGLYRGRNEIDLAPRKRYRKLRPVILIGGTNGAGKTTILEGIRLCLYGTLSLGERVSQEEYNHYLKECIHRDPNALIPVKSSSVGLVFEYGLAGKLQEYYVERSWEADGNNVYTSLSITRDGEPLEELEKEHANDFLRDLIPRGVSQLFFFDGEKIQEMAKAADDDLALLNAVKELLGLDLVSRLRNDLSIYTGRLHESSSSKKLKKELRKINSQISSIQKEQLNVTRTADQNHSRVDRYLQEIAHVERKLSKQGGAFVNKREQLIAEEKLLKIAVSDIQGEIRNLCSDLLPFTLAPALCLALKDQLKAERITQNWVIHQEILGNQISNIKKSLDKKLFPKKDSSKISQVAKGKISQRVEKLFDKLTESPKELLSTEIIHRVSEEERDRLLNAVDRVISDIPKQIQLVESKLEEQVRRLLQVKSALDQIPDDDVLEPMVKQLQKLHQELGKAESDSKRSEQDLKSISHKLEVEIRGRTRITEEIENSSKHANRQELVTKVQSVLDDYATALTNSKVEELSDSVADCFSQLWRKGDVLRSIKIDPETCSVILLDKHDQIVPKERLSAGEKQIYAISMLWALARVSGRVLPMVIDTPLARLDSKHRSHLVNRYFPHVSHQVIILSTDTEFDETYFRDLQPSISHALHLKFNDDEACTVVEEGYFWEHKEKEAEVIA